MIRTATATFVVGAIAWALTAGATLVTVIALSFGVENWRHSSDHVRTSLALLSLIFPLAVGAVVFIVALGWFSGRWRINSTASVLLAAIFCGASLYGFGQVVSAFNSCGLGVSLPYPWFGPCDSHP